MVLLTGGTGFVGGHLLIHLIRAGRKVRAIFREQSSFKELELICQFYGEEFQSIMKLIDWFEADLLIPERLFKAMRDVQEIYHCAAVVSFSDESSDLLRDTNIRGTQNLIDSALKANINHFIFVSSIGALGQSTDNKPVTETTRWNKDNQSSIYSNSKYLSEQEVWKGMTKGMNVIVVNPGIILGAGDFSKGSLKLFSLVQRGMPFYTRQITGYVDVRDVCRAILLLREKNLFNTRFILVSENLSNKTLFTLVANAFGKRPPTMPVGDSLLYLASLMDKIAAKLSGKKPLLSKEFVKSATKKETYSSDKFLLRTDFAFIPIDKCIDEAINGQNH